jgi:outer membrane protein assembly factor BamB
LRPVLALAFLLIGADASARSAPPTLQEFAVFDGNVLFVVPHGVLTILDAERGSVLFSRRYTGELHQWNPLSATGQGLLVLSNRGTVYRMLDHRTGSPVWEFESVSGCHLTRTHLICRADSQAALDARARLEGRRLSDGAVAWRTAAGGRRGEILDGEGRVMVTAEEDGSAMPDGGPGSFSRRVLSVTIIDIETGREIVTLGGLGIDLAAHGSPMSFDGKRVAMDVVVPAGHSCHGVLRRVLTLNAGATGFVASESCEVPPPARPEVRSAGAAGVASPHDFPLSDGVFRPTQSEGGATAFEVRTPRGTWRVEQPIWEGAGCCVNSRVERVWDAEDKVFVESSWRDVGIQVLDCLDIASGRNLWRYVFASELPSSKGEFHLYGSNEYLVQATEEHRLKWDRVRAEPPPALVVVATRTQETATGAAPARTAPVIVEPDMSPAIGELIGRRALAWLALSLVGLAGAIGWRHTSGNGHPGVPRLVMVLGLTLYVAMWFVWLGNIDRTATIIAYCVFALLAPIGLLQSRHVPSDSLLGRIVVFALTVLALLAITFVAAGPSPVRV